MDGKQVQTSLPRQTASKRDEEQAHETLPKRKARKHVKRSVLIIAILLASALIATLWALSSLGLLPGSVATILTIVVTVFAAAFALLPLIPADHASEPAMPAPIVLPDFKIELVSPVPQTPAPSPAKLWTIPYQRNAFFTGRADVLLQLHDSLTAQQATALTQAQAIHGLGGIGKTQLAIEYAYRYAHEYAYVIWLNAATAEGLLTEYASLANDHLHLPPLERDARYQERLVAQVQQWFAQTEGWLLILDNADDLRAIQAFIPNGGKGHLILTTRATAVGGFASLEIERMSANEGVVFLLRRAKLLAHDGTLEQFPEQTRAEAVAIVKELDGLPLALDQAGAYLEEVPTCTLASYLHYYRRDAQKFLDKPGQTSDHPLSVRVTFKLCFAQVLEQSTLAAELLRGLAFLDPTDIPLTLLQDGANQLGPQLATLTNDEALLGEAISVLQRYSLVTYHKDRQACSLHRLVQVVLKGEMATEEQQEWKTRIIKALADIFPGSDVTTWETCERYLPHAQICAVWIEEDHESKENHLQIVEAARLLNKIGRYLHDLALYAEALPLYEHALAIREKMLAPGHPHTATSLNNLALLYHAQGKYELALPLYHRALAIREKTLGHDHPNTAQSLNNLAGLYNDQGKYELALPLLEQALAIREKMLDPNHPDTATSLNNLAGLYNDQGKYELALPLLEQALAIREKMFGHNHPDTATSLNSLAMLYHAQGEYELALPLLEQALAIREKMLGPDHPDTATSLNNLAMPYYAQQKYELVLPLLEQALAIREKTLGHNHPDTATSLNNLAVLYYVQGKYELALPFYQQALAIREKTLGHNHPHTATSLNNLAGLYKAQEEYELALPRYERALAIHEKTLGSDHPKTKTARANYNRLLEAMEKRDEG